MSTPASTSVIVRFSGSVSEYAVARTRNESSTEWERSSVTPRPFWPRRRHWYHATRTTSVQPMPMSSRLEPVMLARVNEQGDALALLGAWQTVPYFADECPPFHANTKLIAYSGSTAMKASRAMARPAEMSSWATSAAHERTKAAPTMAAPKSTAAATWGTCGWTRRSTIPGAVTRPAAARKSRWRPGWTSAWRSSSTVVTAG